MDYQNAFNIVVTLAAFLGGWVLNNITKALDRLDKDVRDMPNAYVSKADYRDDIREIKKILTKIDDKMDKKADK